jgi:hypothetical protein
VSWPCYVFLSCRWEGHCMERKYGWL